MKKIKKLALTVIIIGSILTNKVVPGADPWHIYESQSSLDPRLANLMKAHRSRHFLRERVPLAAPAFSLSIAFIIQLTFLFQSIAFAVKYVRAMGALNFYSLN